jgi:hypothetical protein
MRFTPFNFRHGQEILELRPGWRELEEVIASIERQEIVAIHRSFQESGKRVPAGGQTAINAVFRSKLVPMGWVPEPRLFTSGEQDLRRWKMDFIKERIGVEVSFNHAEAVPWTFTRLNIAGESERVVPEHVIDVGVAIFATESLKRWAKMDSAVGTFELARVWLNMMKPIMPIPILMVGLEAEGWLVSEEFRGTRGAKAH